MNPYNGRYFFTVRANSSNGAQWSRVGNEFATHSMMVACFDSSGEALWLRENTSDIVGTLQLYNLTFDEENNIYIAGRFFGIAGNTIYGLRGDQWHDSSLFNENGPRSNITNLGNCT